MLKLDLHVHTIKSKCSLNPLKYISNVAKRSDFLFAVTDHNLLTRIKNTIPGEEIKTNAGEVIGLYLNKPIKPWQDVFETIDKIHEQGGLAILAHPFDKIRKDAAKNPSKKLIKAVDFIEFNARSLNSFISKTRTYGHLLKKPFSVGSDSHFPWELGNSYLKVDANKKELLSSPQLLKKTIINANKDNSNFKLFKHDWIKLGDMLLSGISSRSRRLFKND